MIFQPLSLEAYQAGEQHQLGAPVGVYIRRVTLSGKIGFTGLLLFIPSLIIDVLFFAIWGVAASSIAAPLGIVQMFILSGSLFGNIRHEEPITPLHPKLSISVYTEGLIYQKGRRVRVLRWEEIQSITRLFRIYRRKGKITHVSPAYTCVCAQKPDLNLSAAIDDVTEIGTLIEHELTKRLLPQIQADYQAGTSVTFSPLLLTQQYIGNAQKTFDWTSVRRIEIDLENLVIEGIDGESNRLTVPLVTLPNLCVLEALLKNIREEKGFALSLAKEQETQENESIEVSAKLRKRQRPKKTSWVSSLMLVLLFISGLALETWTVHDNFNSEQLTELPSQNFHVSGPPTLIIKVDAIDHLFMLNRDKIPSEVSIFGWKKATGVGRLDDIQQYATQNGNTINLSWTMKQTPFLDAGSEKIDLYVQLPTNSNVQIETHTGELVIGYLRGEIKVKTQSGHINIQAELHGHSQLQSTSGQIDYCGTLDPHSSDLFESGSGNIGITLLTNAAFSLLPSSNLNRITNDFGSNEVGTLPNAQVNVTTRTGTIAIHRGNAPDPMNYC